MKRVSRLLMLCCFTLTLLTMAPVTGYGADPEVLLVTSNQAQAAGRYKDAITGYQELLASGLHSAAIHYNLGIAHFKNNELGQAIFHFYQAFRLDPRDGDIRFNLEYSRKKTQDKIEDRRPPWAAYGYRLLPVNNREVLYLAFFALLAAVAAGVVHVYYKNDLLRWTLRLLLVFAALALLVFFGRMIIDEPVGVVTAKTADVFSGQGENNVLLFTLHEGAEFTIEDQAKNNSWIRIRLNDGKKGWIAKADVVCEASERS